MYLKSMKKEACCGCRACADICSKKCIEMKEDAEGFVFPVVHVEDCMHCGLCEKVCPMQFGDFARKEDESAWAGIHKSEEVVMSSSSGGAFTAICDFVLQQEYRVYGVIFDNNFKVIHQDAITTEACKAFRKSKYVMSDTNRCFSNVVQNLHNGEKVLFTGTPCQCAALIRYLQLKHISRDNLLIADIICHGAPNQKIFDSYRAEFERDNKAGELCRYTFRNKQKMNNRINSRSAELKFSSGTTKLVDSSTDCFLLGYYSRLFYRSSCGNCRFARPERVSDLTLGDAWGISKIIPQWDPLKGVSLILANTEKGKQVASAIHEEMGLRPVTVEWAVSANEQLRCPTKMHPNRDLFFKLWPYKGFSFAVNRAIRGSLVERIVRKMKAAFKVK